MQRKTLKTLQIVMINVIAVDSIRTLPFSAELGFSLLFFYLLAALCFFIPSGLVAAELGTGWPKTGGIYVWVKEAFGKKVGLCVIWINWIYNVVWYPTIMALIAGTLTYFFNPDLAENRLYMATTVVTLFWIATLVNCFGMKVSSWISTVGALVGTILPMLFITAIGILSLLSHVPSQIAFTGKDFLPKFFDLPFFSSILFGLLGLEMAATHAAEMKNPKRDYPRSVFIAIVIILLTITLSSLSMAVIVPHKGLSLSTGILQAFFIFFHAHHMDWMIPLVAGAIIIGGLSGVSAWIIGPTKGLMVAAQDKLLPPSFTKKNRHHVPVRVLLTQGVIVTALSLAFVLMPTVNSSFWLLSQITAQLALIVYMGLFAAGIRLRYKTREVSRTFTIPGKRNLGMWLVGGIGALTCIGTFGMGFIPPKGFYIGEIGVYEATLVIGILLGVLSPLVFTKKTL